MKESSNSIQVIERLAQLLDVIAAHDEPVSLKVLSAETGLHPSTAFRILSSLAEQGFVERSTRGNYQLGIKLMQLGSRVRTGVDIRKIALPLMEKLRDQLDETVNLTVREEDEVVYIERSLAKRMIRVEQVIGSRAPPACDCGGQDDAGRPGRGSLPQLCQAQQVARLYSQYPYQSHRALAGLRRRRESRLRSGQ